YLSTSAFPFCHSLSPPPPPSTLFPYTTLFRSPIHPSERLQLYLFQFKRCACAPLWLSLQFLLLCGTDSAALRITFSIAFHGVPFMLSPCTSGVFFPLLTHFIFPYRLSFYYLLNCFTLYSIFLFSSYVVFL